MCGRFAGHSRIRQITRLVERLARIAPDADLPPSYNVAPTQQIRAVRLGADGVWELCPLRWGLVPAWAKEINSKYSMINATCEGIEGKPAYRGPFKNKRCLIPADGFFEWMKTEGGKQPYLIHLASGEPFCFAGLWEHWERDGQVVESCTIITCEPNELMARMYDRMPVILPPKQYDLWMEPTTPLDQLKAVLGPFPADALLAVPVSKAINSPQNNRPELLEPIGQPL